METERFEQFIESQVQNGMMSSGTARKYRAAVERFREWRDTAGEPTPEEIQDFILSLAVDQSLTGATLNVYKCALGKYLSAVNRAQEYAGVRMWFRDNFSSSSGGTPDYLTREEMAAVRQAASADPMSEAMVALFARTGLRVGELVALDMDDIVFDADPPEDADVPDDERYGYVQITRTKRQERVTDRRRLHEADLDAIDRYMEAMDDYGPPLAVSDAALFVTDRQNGDGSYRITENTVRDMVTSLGERADHPDVTGDRLHPHLFRHTVGSWLGQEGYSADQIGAYLGKATGAERYTHFDAGQHDDMADALDAPPA